MFGNMVMKSLKETLVCSAKIKTKKKTNLNENKNNGSVVVLIRCSDLSIITVIDSTVVSLTFVLLEDFTGKLDFKYSFYCFSMLHVKVALNSTVGK